VIADGCGWVQAVSGGCQELEHVISVVLATQARGSRQQYRMDSDVSQATDLVKLSTSPTEQHLFSTGASRGAGSYLPPSQDWTHVIDSPSRLVPLGSSCISSQPRHRRLIRCLLENLFIVGMIRFEVSGGMPGVGTT